MLVKITNFCSTNVFNKRNFYRERTVLSHTTCMHRVRAQPRWKVQDEIYETSNVAFWTMDH